ncbi:MAG: peptide chain release factor N(5)-glutamine methyltransferase [Clostridiales bacterium]|nr:peptide chain release factor N(5)-glutamine methyltransferase [Clostridiales bacterium]
MSKKKTNRTYIGGQALMEGVMMRGKRAMASAVRDPQGAIQVESEYLTPPEKRKKATRMPFIRGVVNFVHSLTDGTRVLMRSMDVAVEDDDEQTKAEQWLKEKHKIDVSGIMQKIAVFFAVVLAVGLFVIAPKLLAELVFDSNVRSLECLWYNLMAGGIRLFLFLAYVILIALLPDMKRVYMCHGAEHKTITCFEQGKPLTVENVRGCSRVHDRCGTTFLFIVVVVSILVGCLVNTGLVYALPIGLNKKIFMAISLASSILILPIIAGISYEILRLLAKTDSVFFLPFKAPGLLLQRLTTREPEDGMIECAITAFETVVKMEADQTIPERVFVTPGKMSALLSNTKKRFRDNNIEEDEAEWIFALTLKMKKDSVAKKEKILRVAEAREIIRIADERLTGRPLWYIFGDTNFCGYTLKVDERVLIPRPETEEMVMMVVGAAEEGNSILDLCTGSGAIAIATLKELEKYNREVKITAVDISEGALEVAKQNARLNNAFDIKFIQSDLFEKVRGKFDIIVSNPPYIPTATIDTLQREVRDHEPRLALDGGEDGLDFYRRIAQEAPKHLTRGGMLIMEVGEGEAKNVVSLFKNCSYSIIVKDFNGIDRYVKIVM